MSFEYHGWAVARNSPKDAGLSTETERGLRQLLADLADDHREIGGRFINGEFSLWASGLSNHRGPDFDDVRNLFSALADLAPGSYGLLYFRDLEDRESSEVFHVLVLARGRLQQVEDLFLSPCVPAIED